MLTGTLPESVGSLSNIVIFNIANNGITGKLSDSIGNWKKLQYLSLFENRFTGPLPSSISTWSDLISFDVHVSQWIGMSCQNFSLSCWIFMGTVIHLLTLLVISWQDNEFEGTLPPATWTKLENFYVGDNFFTGTLSESIGSFSQLTFFRIENNQFTGTLPSSIGLWTQLQSFYTAGDPPGNTLNFEVRTCFSIKVY